MKPGWGIKKMGNICDNLDSKRIAALDAESAEILAGIGGMLG